VKRVSIFCSPVLALFLVVCGGFAPKDRNVPLRHENLSGYYMKIQSSASAQEIVKRLQDFGPVEYGEPNLKKTAQ